MKLIIQNNRIIATALDNYIEQGFEQAVIDAPADYDEAKRDYYRFVDGELVFPASDVNAAQAKALLLDSDWSDLPSVRNTAMTPHLVNTQDFDTYRAALRAIVVDKPAVVEAWPVQPDAVWSTQA
jgi:hypothetical protein